MNDVPRWMWDDDHSVFRDHVGYAPIAWREGYVELELTLGEKHRNRSGIAHGGVIATLIDAAGGFAGCWCPHRDRIRRASTLSLNTQFVSPGRLGRRLVTTGRARAGGKSIFFATMEILDDEGKLVATGEGVYKYRPGSETSEGVPRDAAP
ncbi:MAG: PaaI family thioesterase [Rhodospirillales bacterium]|nr:PaaI family thioesterase [Rhodospirillales bacterium]